MLVVAGTIEIDPEHRDTLLTAVGPMVAATRAEAGCRAYASSADPEDLGLVRLYELWDDQAALDNHFAAPGPASPPPGEPG